MDIVEIAKATAGYTTAVSVVALGAALFVYVAVRKRERSIRQDIIGDAALSSRDLTQILKQFNEDKLRLEALKTFLHDDAATAQKVLERANRFDVSLSRAQSRTGYVTGMLVVGFVLLAFGILGIVARAQDSAPQAPVGRSTMPADAGADLASRAEVHLGRAPPGMVRFARSSIRLGRFEMARRPPECFGLKAEEDCSSDTHPEGVRTDEVPSFDLDLEEVTTHDFAGWLVEIEGAWELSQKEAHVAILRAPPKHPLAWGGDAQCSGLRIGPDRTVSVRPGSERLPVACVTWYAADGYCRAKSKRLPTELEWELAAKGPEERPFPWGFDPPSRDGVAFDTYPLSGNGVRDVGTSKQDRTDAGVYDLAANVAEWVDGVATVGSKWIRGGSWASRSLCHLLTSGCKSMAADQYVNEDVGFRCARSVLD